MRSVFAHLKNVDPASVAAALDSICDQRDDIHDQWLCLSDGDPVLYVGFYTDHAVEYELDEWTRLTEALGCTPSVSVVADVSGRHDGRPEVIAFLKALLDQFDGVVQDDFEPVWTMQQVLNDDELQGHRFFR